MERYSFSVSHSHSHGIEYLSQLIDFGLYAMVPDDRDYTRELQERVPIRYRAPENLLHRKFIPGKTDAWSFGI